MRSKSGAVVRTLASHRRQGPGSNPGVDTIRGVAKFSTSCREMEGELATTSPEFKFHFQFPCGSPSTELSDFHQSARSGNERKCKQKLKKYMPRVMTSLLMSSPPISLLHRPFRCTYSNSRDVVASSPSFFPSRL